MVYLHSGLFTFGSIGTPDLDPSNLTVTHDIVVVTVQYRLGALGFASFSPENRRHHFQSVGLQDQVKALEWIVANIALFGGDPEQITLAGHGAGAVSIGIHLHNPAINQLFKRVLVQGLDNIWNIGLYGMNDRASRFMASDLGCDLSSSSSSSFETTSSSPTASAATTITTIRLWKKCMKKMKIHINSIIESQQHQLEVFAVPFGPEFSPYTNNIDNNNKNGSAIVLRRPSIEHLKQLFCGWNLFPSHIE